MTCPNCGTELRLVDRLGLDTAPWGCFVCNRGWWHAELTPVARRDWDPLTRSFTGAARGRVAAEVEDERARERQPGPRRG